METIAGSIATMGWMSEHVDDPLSTAAALLLGLAWFLLLDRSFRRRVWAVVALQTVVGLLLVGIAERALGIDAPAIVLDEFLAVPFMYAFIRSTDYRQASLLHVAALALFVLLDSIKPLGIALVEQLPGALGVVGDDVVAALVVGGILAVAVRITRRG